MSRDNSDGGDDEWQEIIEKLDEGNFELDTGDSNKDKETSDMFERGDIDPFAEESSE